MSAPILDLPATPAKEWADSTQQAIQSSDPTPTPPIPTNVASDTHEQREARHPAIPHFASTGSTPGPDLPGAYPKGEANEHDVRVTGEDVEHVKQTVATNVTGIIETAKQYLPQAVTSYFPAVAPQSDKVNAATSLPSTEVHGDTSGNSKGAGALPGNVTESAVAKLPEERAADGSIMNTTEVGSEGAPPIQTTTNTLAHLSLQDASGADTDLTKDHLASSAAGTGGVGDLPGSASETAIALLPEEKNLPTGGAGDLPGKASEPAVAVLPEERKQSKSFPPAGSPDAVLRSKAPASVLSTTAVAGHTPIDTPASTKHDLTSPTVQTDAPPVPSKPSPSASDKPKGTSVASSDAASSGSSGKKTGLMAKLKGEAKVISGKISRNDEKVEEGKKLLGKI